MSSNLLNQYAEQAYIQQKQLQGLAAKQTESESVLLFSELFAYVFGQNQTDSAKVEQQINQSLVVRKQYLALLQQAKWALSEQQAAASTSQILSERTGQGFSIKFKTSERHPEQVYVIVNIEHSQSHHQAKSVILHLQLAQTMKRLILPAVIDNKTQIMLQSDSEEFKLLSNENTLVYLL